MSAVQRNASGTTTATICLVSARFDSSCSRPFVNCLCQRLLTEATLFINQNQCPVRMKDSPFQPAEEKGSGLSPSHWLWGSHQNTPTARAGLAALQTPSCTPPPDLTLCSVASWGQELIPPPTQHMVSEQNSDLHPFIVGRSELPSF